MDRRERSPLWLDTRIDWAGGRHAPLTGRIKADVTVVGGGITGLTTAYLLSKAGKRVALLEADRIGAGETGRTSGHVTHVIETALTDLVDQHGFDDAKAVWDGAKFAVETIAAIVHAEGIDCDFQRVPGCLFTDDSAEKLARIAALAAQMGYPSHQGPVAGLPFTPHLMLEFADQARFHPMKYLNGLVHAALSRGVRIYEDSVVAQVHGPADAEDGVRITSESGAEVVCEHVVIAAHVPFNNRVFVHTKQAPYRTYVVALRVAKGQFPDALLDDMLDPYHYIRIHPRAQDDLLIVGGNDHKTGQEEDHEGTQRFERLIDYARTYLHCDAPVAFQWSGQVMQSFDGLPLIGLNAFSRDDYIATGFGGDGLTFGTLAAHILSERIVGRTTIWDEMFSPERIELDRHAVARFLGENKDYPVHLLKDWFARGAAHASPASLKPGEGALFKINGQRLAVSRQSNGQLLAVSPACTHMGCSVHWNEAETTWDCPCHGSRFAADGAVINGPATKCLARQDLVTEPTQEAEPFHFCTERPCEA